jgi:sterol desaturase/sphingolipid hydroxylase (fatty acid hydroxylase superfamily)
MNAWITHLWHNSVTHLRVPVRHFLFFSLVCTLLALFFPSKRSQPILRRGLITDIIYYFLVPIWYEPLDAVLKLGLVAFAYSHATTTHLLKYGLAPLGDMPYWSQVLLGMLMADVMIYWLHRSSHIFPLLWRFHVIHHSSSDVDWLSSGRFHIVNLIFQNTIPMAVLLLVGFSPQALAWVAFLLWFGSILEHCNLNWSFGPLRYVVVSPVYHRWHHTYSNEGGNKNFAAFFPFLDIIFGTFYMPSGQHPMVFGTEREKVPNGFLGQIVYPFLKSAPIE